MPDVCQWVDVVKVDLENKIRTEKGKNITKSDDGVIIIEESKWWWDNEKKTCYFHRKLDLSVPSIPEYFISKCINVYDINVMRIRNEEAETIRKNNNINKIESSSSCCSEDLSCQMLRKKSKNSIQFESFKENENGTIVTHREFSFQHFLFRLIAIFVLIFSSIFIFDFSYQLSSSHSSTIHELSRV